MLLDAEELQSYLQYAFNHFACTMNVPFDFVQASFLNSPIPPNFGGNILKLAIRLMEIYEDEADAPEIFEKLSYMVASCIMFDSARHKKKGPLPEFHIWHADAPRHCRGHIPSVP